MALKGQERESPSLQKDANRTNQRWGNKSLRKYRSYRVAANNIKNKLHLNKNEKNVNGDGWSSESEESYGSFSDSNWTSEKHIESDQNSDGIEIFMNGNGNGMELMHIIGTKHDDEGMPLTSDSSPTIQVSYIQMATNYHPACDYNTQHRIKTASKNVRSRDFTKEQKLVLLENHQVTDEESATRDEIHKNLIEMRNLENERDSINRQLDLKDGRLVSHRCSIPLCCETSDVDGILDQVNKGKSKCGKKCMTENHLEWDYRRYLQRRRGFCFHASFDDPESRDMFTKICGGNRHDKAVHPLLQNCNEPFYVEKVAASAAAVRHIAITRGAIGNSFFVSKDDGRAYWDEGLPNRLINRLEDEKISSNNNGAIRYLVCGPKQSYYAQLVSGQSLWSISTVDEEFRNVMDTFEVQRVAFGPFTTGPSWIIIGQNGKVAWRNLPCRLDMLLSKRTSSMSAPCEVSLGEYGSYFIRFLDGEIDYCLPAHIAASCQEILDQGADITNIALHPETSEAFIIRHTQLP